MFRRLASTNRAAGRSARVLPVAHGEPRLGVAEVAAPQQQGAVLAAGRPLVREHAEAGVPAHPVDVGVEKRDEVGEARVEGGRVAEVDPLRLAELRVDPLGVDLAELEQYEALALLRRVPQLERDVRRGERVGREHEEERVGALDRLI